MSDQSASEQMFPVVNRELFDAVVKLNAANGVRASELKHILTDLIAELRDHPAGEYCCCGWCDRDRERADRAEARLRKVQGE